MELEELARKYALKNAVEYGGEANSGAVVGKVMAEVEASPDEVGKVAGKICSKVNRMSLEEQEEAIQKYEFEQENEEHDPLPDLEDAKEGEVVLRFAPNPNGPPHIGHAKGMVINGELKQKYSGKLILRFDDTDPRNKRPLKTDEHDAYEMFREDYEWLGYEIDEIRYSSKNFDKYIEYAEKLIEMEKAYVCFCNPEEGSEYRSKGKACPHRDKPVEENLADWEEMKKRTGEIKEGEATLKIKTNLDHKNPAVRDFVAFRIIEEPDHPITGDKFRVWPMLDFAGALEDHFMGTTHIVRGKDLRASTKRQNYIYDYLDWEYPNIRYWGSFRISGFEAPVSGSSLKQMIEQGELEGWDDVRAPTVRALRRRGFQPEALKEFFIDMGVNEKDVQASVDTLNSFNRNIVEESDRYFFVSDPIDLEISNVPEGLQPELPLHPDKPERGNRDVRLQKEDGKIRLLVEKEDLNDGFLRLKGLCNVRIDEGEAKYAEGDHRDALERGSDIIHWVKKDSPEAKVMMPDGAEIEGRVETNEIVENEVVQFERFGFLRCDDEEGKIFCYTHD